MGKVIHGIGSVCKEEGITCIALSGNTNEAGSSVNDVGVTAFFSISDSPITLNEAMNTQNTLRLIEKQSEQIFRLFSV
jgi:glycerate kinase